MKRKFDAVKFQREVREELSEKYNFNREEFLCELNEKYGHLQKGKNNYLQKGKVGTKLTQG